MLHERDDHTATMTSQERAREYFLSGRSADESESLATAIEWAWAHIQGTSRADRASGDNDLSAPNPFAVAAHLRSLNLDSNTQAAALLAAPQVAPHVPLEDIRALNPSLAVLVKGARFLGQFVSSAPERAIQDRARQAENVRRLLLASIEDVRAVLIRLCDLSQRLRLMAHSGDDEGMDDRAIWLATEVQSIYAPLANRLGVAQIKWELEDRAFHILDPQHYVQISRTLAEKRADRERYIAAFVEQLHEHLRDGDFGTCDVFGRPKHIYSIFRKMQRKNLTLEQLFDIRAVRVLVDTPAQCYGVLGVVHDLWTPIVKEFDDYIARPKENGYQSLHTAVIGPSDKPVEVQIRTRAMNEFAEFGVAAHWRYKEGGRHDLNLHQHINALRNILDEANDDDALLDDMRSEFFSDRVYVFTPRGELIDLPSGATPLDFAYHIHTQIGHRCRGARVNGKMVPLQTTLANSDQVEILTRKEAAPSRDWMSESSGFLASSRARNKVRAWFNNAEGAELARSGRQALERELKRAHLEVPTEKLLGKLRFDRVTDLYLALARGELHLERVLDVARDLSVPASPPSADALVDHLQKRARRRRTQADSAIQIDGLDAVPVRLARCCAPVPPEPIGGLILQGRGVAIHALGCQNYRSVIAQSPAKAIAVSWSDAAQQKDYPVQLRLICDEGTAVLMRVTQWLSEQRIGIDQLQLNPLKSGDDFALDCTVRLPDAEALAKLIGQLRQLEGVAEVRRVAPSQ